MEGKTPPAARREEKSDEGRDEATLHRRAKGRVAWADVAGGRPNVAHRQSGEDKARAVEKEHRANHAPGAASSVDEHGADRPCSHKVDDQKCLHSAAREVDTIGERVLLPALEGRGVRAHDACARPLEKEATAGGRRNRRREGAGHATGSRHEAAEEEDVLQISEPVRPQSYGIQLIWVR